MLLATILLASAVLCFGELEPITKDNLDFTRWDTVLRNLVKVNDTINDVHLNSFNYAGLKDNWVFQNFTWQVEMVTPLDLSA